MSENKSENKLMPQPSTTEAPIEHTEKGSLTGSAALVGMTPSDQFVTPTMNLDGPPAAAPAEAPAGE